MTDTNNALNQSLLAGYSLISGQTKYAPEINNFRYNALSENSRDFSDYLKSLSENKNNQSFNKTEDLQQHYLDKNTSNKNWKSSSALSAPNSKKTTAENYKDVSSTYGFTHNQKDHQAVQFEDRKNSINGAQGLSDKAVSSQNSKEACPLTTTQEALSDELAKMDKMGDGPTEITEILAFFANIMPQLQLDQGQQEELQQLITRILELADASGELQNSDALKTDVLAKLFEKFEQLLAQSDTQTLESSDKAGLVEVLEVRQNSVTPKELYEQFKQQLTRIVDQVTEEKTTILQSLGIVSKDEADLVPGKPEMQLQLKNVMPLEQNQESVSDIEKIPFSTTLQTETETETGNGQEQMEQQTTDNFAESLGTVVDKQNGHDGHDSGSINITTETNSMQVQQNPTMGSSQKLDLQTEKAPEVPKSEILQQVVEKAKVILSQDKSEMVIELKPETLGKLTLKIVTERGEVMAKFFADNYQVKSVLESNMQLLKDSLQKQGINIQGLSVSVGDGSERQANGQDEKSSKQQDGRKGEKRIPKATGLAARISRTDLSSLAIPTRMNPYELGYQSSVSFTA